MKKSIQLLSVALLAGSMSFAQSNGNLHRTKKVSFDQMQKISINSLDVTPANPNGAGGPCTAPADTWTDLNGAGGAPCSDSLGNCMITDAGFTTIGIYGSEGYVLDGVLTGYDYIFDMCSGFGAGAWIPEITILAPDGSTIDANNAASSTSGQTFNDQCSLGWTATQDGEYTIIINEMGTSTGDAPNQVDCSTSYAVDNGNPTVVCGANAMPCAPAGPCVAGVLDNSDSPVTICPGDSYSVMTDGTGGGDGGVGLYFNPTATGTGALGGAFTLLGVTFPVTVDHDLEGLLSGNGFPEFDGQWVMYAVGLDGADEICAMSADSIVIGFYDTTDAECVEGIEYEEALALEVYPNPSNGTFVVQMDGDNSVTTLTVTDMTGREVYSEAVRIGMNFRTVLDLDLVGGTYLFNVITDQVTVTRKLQIH